MKQKLNFLILLALGLLALGCEKKTPDPEPINVVITVSYDNAPLAIRGIKVSVSDASSTYVLEEETDGSGLVSFNLLPGSYTVSSTYVTSENGIRLSYTGTTGITVSLENKNKPVALPMQKVESRQIIIKELYFGGCNNPETNKGYIQDSYVILYNNSDVEADASEVVFGFLGPYNSFGNNKYRTDDNLVYEKENWVPAYGAIWWFTADVKIPAWSQIVVAIFGAIDHTATVSTSVNLADASYYWMSNSGIAQFTNSKYAASDAIPTSHYLSCSPFTQGNAWALSNSSPAFFIGQMPKAEVEALSTDTENYDHTMGASAAFNVVKFPKDKVIGAIEVYSQANLAKSAPRFPADLNSGYVAITNNQGYSVYRNVDKASTEALPENEGKLVYDYALGTTDVEGTTDPSGIDAEASIANGAHIVYSQTNSTANDFHQRKKASLKK